MSVYLREYGVQTTINFALRETDGVDFRVDAAHATGDTVIMKDEGTEANTANGFTDEGTGYSLVLSATEMQAARIVVYVIDQTATKVWLDKELIIETYGNASAQHAVNLNDSVRAGLTALPNAAADAAGGLPISDAGALDLDGVLSGNTPQTGDSYARLGAPAGASHAADLAAIKTEADKISLADAGAGVSGSVVEEVENVLATLGSPAGADLSADLAAIKTEADKIALADAGAGVAGSVIEELEDIKGTDGLVLISTDAQDLSATLDVNTKTVTTDALDASALNTDAVTEIVNAVKAIVVESNGSITLQEAQSIILAAVAGVTADSGATIKDPSGTNNRIAATINASNERTAMTLTPSS